METLLPNGTIVLLKGGNKRLVIYGRKQIVTGEGGEDIQTQEEEITEQTMYDYIGVPYPEGYISQEYTYAFNHSDIIDIIFRGYEDEEEEEFQKTLRQV
ncbi:hypothetical protein GCM10011409_10230 [Lentibacillus populi]|uniref:Cytoplasmic protein n=1 Tax=Lentibacillus populi TaxID=1827502 RepID=A0A9W5TW27_9BACI|nr:DUF4176 domain-containing protein [Lentibacillus populi]MBT2215302.1 DUF4176 domain-containing protein [Virgibacillus dakarensis]GGB34736.1 hypothetical protein GCM10011409_10230 [Lentibacillus populi]